MASQVAIPDSIPNNTFKNGQYPHMYITQSFQDNPESDTASMNPNLSPLEFVGLRNQVHILQDGITDRAKKPTCGVEDCDQILLGKRGYTIMDATTPKTAAYQTNFKTTSYLETLQSSMQNSLMSRGILLGVKPSAFTAFQQLQAIGAPRPPPYTAAGML
jgi:hypothetical protein